MEDLFGSNDLNNGITRDEFIKIVNDNITVNHSIPYKLKSNAIETIIRNCLDYFYRKYPDALEENYLLLFSSYLNSPEFKKNRAIFLPKNVYSVYGIDKFNAGLDTYGSGDFAISRVIGFSTYSGRSTANEAVDNTINWLTQSSLLSLLNDVILNNTITFKFNRLTSRLMLPGEAPNSNLIIQVQTKIDEEYLFTDDYFRKYVIGKCKIELARVLSMFRINLPGNVEIDIDGLKSSGETEVEQVETALTEEEGMADYFFMSDTN